jgi:tripartite-type tricarboxylate transporter receptor subunit TctC
MNSFLRHLSVACVLLTAFAGSARAQRPAGTDTPAYPNRPIRLVVPSAPGGGTDIVARLIAQGLSDSWGQTVVVDNRGGAGGIPGVTMVAKGSAPDGYTMLLGSNGHVSFAPAIYRRLAFDPQKDLAPASLVANQAFVVAAAQSLPAASLQEFIALAKKNPGKLSYGSGGVGTSSHLGTELLRMTGGFTLLHVPYKGTGPGMTALMGGEIQILLVGLATVLPHVRSKSDKLKVYAVTSARRSPAAPDIPTVAEAGLPGYDFDVWYGMVLPGGTPHLIVVKTSTEIVRLLKTPALRERFAAAGLEPLGNTPDEFAAQIRSEIPKWIKVAREGNIQVD